MKLYEKDYLQSNYKRILNKKSKLTWKESYILHKTKYVNGTQRSDVHPATLEYHQLCMKRADQHINGLKNGDRDLRNRSSKSLFSEVSKKYL